MNITPFERAIADKQRTAQWFAFGKDYDLLILTRCATFLLLWDGHLVRPFWAGKMPTPQ
ncbi:hypothetical protein [Nostoc sp.]|uniref:hypothetical protein n=1 Tax=Nostoc sp. TaxID=1180 RepID=UPI002FF958FD